MAQQVIQGIDAAQNFVELELDADLHSTDGSTNENDADLDSTDGSANENDYDMVIENDSNESDPVLPELNMRIYAGDNELDIDVQNGWKMLAVDNEDGVPAIPFMGSQRLRMFTEGRQPVDFFDELFDNSMWQDIADQTNLYAYKQKRKFGADAAQRANHVDFKRHSRLNFWKDVSVRELKIFFAHIIVMGIVRKPDIEKYWQKSGPCRTPFFGKWMSRNRFTAILSNLHLAEDEGNPAFGRAGHNPLAKIQPFVDMCSTNFKFIYSPDRDLAIDESCCPWNGRLRFKVYNPRKPARFHIKLFQMCESVSGYISAFMVYTGKGSCHRNDATLNPDCGRTTKTVMTLAENAGVLDKGHRIYMDNFYTSPELIEELLYRDTPACGTVRLNRKGLPKAITKTTKMQKNESCFRRSYNFEEDEEGPLLCVKWCDKRQVTLLTTIHTAREGWTGKCDRSDEQNPIYKPTCILDYNKNMSGVDLSDQLMMYYSFLRKSCKWWRKLFFHLFEMLLLNAYILNRKFGARKMSHRSYREEIAMHLLGCAVALPENVETAPFERFQPGHFPVPLPEKNGKVTALRCSVCSVSAGQAKAKGLSMRRKSSSFKCGKCNVVMCIHPCFEIHHTEQK